VQYTVERCAIMHIIVLCAEPARVPSNVFPIVSNALLPTGSQSSQRPTTSISCPNTIPQLVHSTQLQHIKRVILVESGKHGI